MKQPLLILVLLTLFYSFLPYPSYANGDLSEINSDTSLELLHEADETHDELEDLFCPLNFHLTATPAACGDQGLIDIRVTAGNGPYHIEWDNGDNSVWGSDQTPNPNSVIPNLPPGNYTVKISNGNCNRTKIVTIENHGNGLTLDHEAKHATCGNLGGLDINVYNSSPPYWLYVSGPVTGSAQTNSSSIHVPDLPAGNYEVSLEKGSCVETFWVTINGGGSSFDYALEVTDATCGSHGSSWVTISGGQPNYQIHIWDDGNIDYTTTVSKRDFQIENIPAGNYTIKIVDYYGCELVKTFAVGGGGNLAYSVSPTNAVCGGYGSVNINIGAGSPEYSVDIWGPNDYSNWFAISNSNFNVSNLSAGAYTIEITDKNGCKKTETFTIGSTGTNLTLALESNNASCSATGSVWVTCGGGQAPYTVAWSGASSGSQSTSDGGVSITGLSAGSYTVTSTDYNGCSISKTVEVVGSGDLAYSVTPSEAVCGGYGSASIYVSSGSPEYSVDVWGPNDYFNWFASSKNSFSVDNLVAGSYTIEITDANDCKQTRTFTVGTSVSTVTLALEATNANCTTSGSIWATSGGGQAPYTVAWSGPSSGSQSSSSGSVNITGLTAGSYTVTSTDYKGCLQSQTISVGGSTNNIGLVANVTNGNCNTYGSIDLSVSSGQAPYDISWSGTTSGTATINGSSYSIPNLGAGTYTITIKDYYGCTVSKTVTVSHGSSSLSATVETQAAKCNEAGSAWITISGGSGPYKMNMVGPINGTATITSAGYTIPSLIAGQYSLTFTDYNGCQTVKSFTIGGSSDGPVIGLKATDGICNQKGLVEVTISGGRASYSVSWSGPTSGSASTNNTSYQIPNLSAGSYEVTVADYDGCTSKETVHVNAGSSNISIGANSFLAHCGNPGSISTQISGGQAGYTLSWSGPSSGTAQTSNGSYNITGLYAGSYKLIATDYYGCSVEKTVEVSSSGGNVTVGLTPYAGSCGSAGSIGVAVSGGQGTYTVSWTGAGTNSVSGVNSSSGYTIQNAVAGTYEVTVTDKNGCSTVQTVSLSSSGSNISFGMTPVAGSCGSTGSIGLNISGGQPSYTVSWSGPTEGSQVSTSTGYTIPNAKPGTYTVTVKDKNGCSTTNTVSVSNGTNNLGIALQPYPGKCGNKGSLGVTISGGQGVYDIHWSGASTGSTTANGSVTLDNLTSGDYTIVVTDKNGCQATGSANITASSSAVSIDLSAGSAGCSGYGFIDVAITGTTPKYTVHWVGPKTNSTRITGNSYRIKDLPAGKYSITVTDENACSIYKTITVESSGASNLQAWVAGTNGTCTTNGSIGVTISGGTPDYTVKWTGPTPGSATVSSGFTIPNLGAGSYTISITDKNGCSVTKTASVSNSTVGLPTASCSATVDGKVVTFTSTSSMGDSYWNFGDGNSSTKTHPTHTYSAAGTYTVCLTVTNACGTDEECKTVIIKESQTNGGGGDNGNANGSGGDNGNANGGGGDNGNANGDGGDNGNANGDGGDNGNANGDGGDSGNANGGGGDSGNANGGGGDNGNANGNTGNGGGLDGGETSSSARVKIAEMSAKTGDVVQLPVTVENCGRLATLSGEIVVEDESIIKITGLSPSAISPQYNTDNFTFSFFSTGLGTDITDETVLFYVNIEILGEDGQVGRIMIEDGIAELEMTCTSEGFNGPIRPDIIMGEVSIRNQTTAFVSGLVHTFWGEGIEEAMVAVSGEEYISRSMTTELGTYEVEEVPMDVAYQITPSKEDNPLNGLSTYGLFIAQKYLLGYETNEITSPYQVIAMDANCDNRFTTFDLFVMQQLVIGNISDFPGCPSWVFVKEDFEFEEDFSPSNVFPYESTYTMMMDKESGQANFIGVKVGDILGRAMASATTLTSADSRSNQKTGIAFTDQAINAGEEVEITFTKSAFKDLASYQLGLNVTADMLEIVELIPSQEEDFVNTIAGIKDNQVKVSWYNTNGVGTMLSEDETLFTLKVRAKANIASLDGLFSINKRFESTAHTSTQEVYDLEIVMKSTINASKGMLEVLQNMPNPFKETTAIFFELPTAGNVDLQITDQYGRIVRSMNQEYVSGQHQIILNRGDLGAGLYYYTISSNGQSITKRMLIIE